MTTRLDEGRPYAVALFRIVTGLLFASHGAAALFGVLGGAHGGGTVAFGVWPDWYAAVIELAAGAWSCSVWAPGRRLSLPPARWRTPTSPSTSLTPCGRCRTTERLP